ATHSQKSIGLLLRSTSLKAPVPIFPRAHALHNNQPNSPDIAKSTINVLGVSVTAQQLTERVECVTIQPHAVEPPVPRAWALIGTAYRRSRSGGFLGPQSRIEAHGIAAGRNTDQSFRDDGDHGGQHAREGRSGIMALFGKRQVFILLDLHPANAV